MMRRHLLVSSAVFLIMVLPTVALGVPTYRDGDLSDWGYRRTGGLLCDDGIISIGETTDTTAIDFNSLDRFGHGARRRSIADLAQWKAVRASGRTRSIAADKSVPSAPSGTGAAIPGSNSGNASPAPAVTDTIVNDAFDSLWGDPSSITWTEETGADAVIPDNASDSVPPIPEPTTLLLIGAGLLGVAAARKKRIE
jgi:hypothetical protein